MFMVGIFHDTYIIKLNLRINKATTEPFEVPTWSKPSLADAAVVIYDVFFFKKQGKAAQQWQTFSDLGMMSICPHRSKPSHQINT